MTDLERAKGLIAQGEKDEAWGLLNKILTTNPANEAAWLLAYEIASESRKDAVLEKAGQYLPSNSLLFNNPLSPDIGPLSTFSDKSRLKSTHTLIAGLFVLVILFCGGASLIIFNSDAYAQLASTPTSPPTRTSTLIPTPTTAPTRAPTATFIPAHTATYTALIEETRYLTETLVYVQRYENALNRFLGQHGQLNFAPSLYWNQAWRVSIIDTMITLAESAEDLARVSPVPTKFAGYHDSTVNLYNQTYAFMLFYANWLDGNSDGKDAIFYIENLNQAFSRMTRELEAIQAP
ncbi:MAG: hypothetical protein KIS88_10645 [Anaerolineales bacterium]|nr:hypothetical protein [Anaerolineales bacterium]